MNSCRRLIAAPLCIVLLIAFVGIQSSAGQCYTLPSPDTGEVRIFAQSVCGSVDNDPPNPTVFTIDMPSTITKIGTYHWNHGAGATPGTIGLKGEDGTIYGPWQASGLPGQGGVPNANWVVTLSNGVDLPAGTYEVMDSDPSTWAYGSESGNSGVVSVVGLSGSSANHNAAGHNTGNENTGQPPCAVDAVDFSPRDPTDLYHAGPLLVPGSYKFYYGKRTGTQIGQPDSWQTYGPIDIHGGKFYVFDIVNGVLSEQDPKMINSMINQPGPTESLVWYRLSTQNAYVVCFDGPLNGNNGGIQIGGQQPTGGNSQAIRLFGSVPTADSSTFKSNVYSAVSVDTSTYDRTPYHMATPYSGTVTIQPGQRCFLAGDSAGQSGWSVDNFLLFEIQTGMGTKYLFCGDADPVSYNGQKVQQVGPSSFSFDAGEVDLTSYFPKGVPVQLKVSALDYGGIGHVSDVYLIIQSGNTQGTSSDDNVGSSTIPSAVTNGNGGIQLAGSWNMDGHQEGFNDWKADLVLNSDSTLRWTETEGANVGATRSGTWQFDGTTITMSWVSPSGGKTAWISREVTKDTINSGTYTVENAPGGTWVATRSYTVANEEL